MVYSCSDVALNKPWRPIPSGRISIHAAKTLSLALVPICFVVSAMYDVLEFSVLFLLLSWSYNEGGLHSAWIAKQFLNALGYGSLELGATAVMGLSSAFHVSSHDFHVTCSMQLTSFLLMASPILPLP
jgi:4-hydroxybenzoate polyprenyltransferase